MASSASAFAGDVAVLRSSRAEQGRGSSGRCRVATTAKESRIGKNSVKVPKGVTVSVTDNLLVAKVCALPAAAGLSRLACVATTVGLTPPRAACCQGPKGELSLQIDPLLSVETVRVCARSGAACACRKKQIVGWAGLTLLRPPSPPQEADGSLRLRKVNDTKRAQMLHGLSRCVARRAGHPKLAAPGHKGFGG